MPPVCAITSTPFSFSFHSFMPYGLQAFKTFVIFMPRGHTTYMCAYMRNIFIYSCLTASHHCSCLTAHRTPQCLICSCLWAQRTRPPFIIASGPLDMSTSFMPSRPIDTDAFLNNLCTTFNSRIFFSNLAMPRLPLSPTCHMHIYAVLAFPANCNWALRVAGPPSDLPPFLICVTTFASITFIRVVIAIIGPIYSIQ